MNRKIVFTTGSLRRGGAERVISILANELVNRGWEVYIITVLFSQVGYQIDNRVKIIDISNESKNQILDTPRLIRAIRKNVKEIKPAIVISFMLTINIVTWLAVRHLNVPFVPSERNDPSQGRNAIKHWLSCKAYEDASKVVFQTERARNYYSEKIQKNGIIIPNPIQVERTCADIRKHKIVSVGRLEPQKNRQLLINAFSDVYRIHSDYTLHIYGEGSQKEELEKLINELGLNSVVILHGNVTDVHDQIADAEIFVLSSNYEGLSNALLEAMMMGLACISTNCAGATESINSGIDGIIVPVDDRNAMTEAINELVSDENKRNDFYRKAQVHANKFKVDAVVDQWEAVICEGESL